MLLTALSDTGRELLIGLSLSLLALALTWWVARNERKYSERVRLPRAEPVDYGSAIYEHRLSQQRREAEEWRPGVETERAA